MFVEDLPEPCSVFDTTSDCRHTHASLSTASHAIDLSRNVHQCFREPEFSLTSGRNEEELKIPRTDTRSSAILGVFMAAGSYYFLIWSCFPFDYIRLNKSTGSVMTYSKESACEIGMDADRGADPVIGRPLCLDLT